MIHQRALPVSDPHLSLDEDQKQEVPVDESLMNAFKEW